MFDLEQSMADWKQRMRASGIRAPETLDELESHLREEAEQQMRTGLTGERAFEIAVRTIGRPNLLRSEFRKTERINMKRIAIVVLGILGVLIGMAFVMRAAAWYRHHEVMPDPHWEFLLLGGVLTLVGLGVALWGLSFRKS